MTDRAAHWDGARDRADVVSWFQSRLGLSLKLINRVGACKHSPILDIGAASTLVDHLLELGFRDLSVLDPSSPILDRAKARLEDRGEDVEWITADIRSWKSRRRYSVWHDRTVLQVLVEPGDQTAYADALRAALAPEGWAIIGAVAPGGPSLNLAQHDAVSLWRLFGGDFELMETHGEMRVTPWGDQAFRYHVFRRKALARRECE